MNYNAEKIRNIALAGHNGSGKTSLAEAILYNAGIIDRMGKTSDGTTVCDYDAEEIKRGISISTSLASFNLSLNPNYITSFFITISQLFYDVKKKTQNFCEKNIDITDFLCYN